MQTEKMNRPLTAILLAATLALSPTPATAQQAGCNSALTEINDYSTRNNVLSIDANNLDYRGCCLAIRLADASREAVRICEAEGVDNQQLRELKSDLAGLPSSLPVSRCNSLSGGSSSCSEHPALSFTPTISQPDPFRPTTPISPITVPDFSAPDISSGINEWAFAGIMTGVILIGAIVKSHTDGEESAFIMRPLLSFQNDDGESLSRYGAKIEYRRPHSPLALHWSAEELRTSEAVSASAQFGGEWRGEIWTFGGEAANRDSRATLALRVGAALERAGWKLRLDAKSAAWNNGVDWSAPETEILLGMERAF